MNVGGKIRPWVAQWWSEEGGWAITFGSDAHGPDWVGRNFSEAVTMAQSFGFRPGRKPADFWTR
jgi:histidinol-phosphatase (PHP family)